jgi:serine/threonine-protein kinase
MSGRVDAPHDVLFGLLAIQNRMVAPTELAATLRCGAESPGRAIAELLVERGLLSPARRALLEALLAERLAVHDGDPERTLADLDLDRATQQTLAEAGGPEVEATLAHVSTRAGFRVSRDTPAGAGGLAALQDDTRRYRVVRPHARGGLGAVYVAMDEELHREVALKQILDAQADDPASRARFLLEAEITGSLEHPGIVPVYGLGLDADGRPYYAMRFIRGETLTEAVLDFHRDEALRADPGRRSLELRKLLRRFTDVCNAIDYAHSRGVLHRDIKPGNVILGKHGETLVVDWGVAKATGRADLDPGEGEGAFRPSSASGTAETLPGRALGTPSYMSPEQAAGDLESLGPPSDVYSLGATLYHLLTGRAPVEGDLAHALRAVKAGEITPPRRLDPTIDPALEAVCLEAMALQPADRYPSARALAEDVERWMADEPVSAWPEPWSRRVRRWAKRNRTLVTAAGVALVAGVAGLTAILVVQTRAHTAVTSALARETRANLALAMANDELARSRAAVEARYDLALDAVKTFHTGASEDFLLKEERFQALRNRLLASAAEFYGKLGTLLGRETDLASRRALAEANFELAGLTARVGRNADALAAHRAVLDARRVLAAAPGAGPTAQVDVGRSLTEIAGLLEAAGKADEAQAAYREAEAALRKPAAQSPEARAALAACRSRMGFFLTTLGKQDEALAAYRLARADQQALVDVPNAPPEARRDLADTINRIGRVLANTGHPREAQVEYRAALAIRQALADAHPDNTDARNALSASHNNIGIELWRSGRLSEAESEYRAALALRKVLADANPAVTEFRKQLQASQVNLGNLLRQAGRLKEAEALFREAAAVDAELVRENPSVPEFRRLLALNYHYLGTVLKAMGRIREAEPEYREAQAVLRDLVASHPNVPQFRSDLSSTHNELGILLAESGRTREAEVEFRANAAVTRALADAYPTVTEYRDRLATGLVNLGDFLSESGQTADAEREYLAAQAAFRGLTQANPATTYPRMGLAYSLNRRGLLLAAAGRRDEAEADDREAAALFGALAEQNPKVPDFSDGLASALTDLGDVLRAAGHTAEAREAYDRAVPVRERLMDQQPKLPSYRASLAALLRRRGLAHHDLGDAPRAASDIRRALELLGGLSPKTPEHWFETACAHAALADLAATDGSEMPPSAAAAEADTALELLRKAVALGYRPRDLDAARSALGTLRNRADFADLLRDLAMPAHPFHPESQTSRP